LILACFWRWLIFACFRLWECGVVLAGVKAKPWRVAYGQP